MSDTTDKVIRSTIGAAQGLWTVRRWVLSAYRTLFLAAVVFAAVFVFVTQGSFTSGAAVLAIGGIFWSMQSFYGLVWKGVRMAIMSPVEDLLSNDPFE